MVGFRRRTAPQGPSIPWLPKLRPPGPPATVPVPRHFHTAGPDRLLQTPDDNPRGFQAIQSPGGNGSGAGITPASDDQPNYYHSFFNFVSPAPASLSTTQRSVIQNDLRRFDAALYSPGFTGDMPTPRLLQALPRLLARFNTVCVSIGAPDASPEVAEWRRGCSVWDVIDPSTPDAVIAQRLRAYKAAVEIGRAHV
jgi:hypothetical protein